MRQSAPAVSGDSDANADGIESSISRVDTAFTSGVTAILTMRRVDAGQTTVYEHDDAMARLRERVRARRSNQPA